MINILGYLITIISWFASIYFLWIGEIRLCLLMLIINIGGARILQGQAQQRRKIRL